MEDVMNVRETAAYLKISQGGLHRLRQQGKIIGRKLGRRLLFTRADIERFLKGLPRTK